MNYFKSPETLEALKKQYRELAQTHHPDNGGTTEAMQSINSEYERLFEKLKNTHQTQDGTTYTAKEDNPETASQFIDLIQQLMEMDDIVIEIIGCFVWVSGKTKPHKDKLKALGFKWHSKKLCWYLPPLGYNRRSRKDYSLEEIRIMYGSNGQVNSKGMAKITASA